MVDGLPETITIPKDSAVDLFLSAMTLSWNLGMLGLSDLSSVVAATAQVINQWEGTDVAPGLMPARFREMRIKAGQVKSVMPTEDGVVHIQGPELCVIGPTQRDFKLNFDLLSMGIERFVQDPPKCLEMHKANAERHGKPPVQVLSTGRCGTVSLLHLISKSKKVQPYHTFWWYVAFVDRLKFLAGLCDQRVDVGDVTSIWASSRAAEWLGTKPAVFLSHLDLVYAPILAAIHPGAKWVHAHRDVEKTFRSFWLKHQEDAQLCPFGYGKDASGNFTVSYGSATVIDSLAFFFATTDLFAAAMHKVFPDRVAILDMDDLFAGSDLAANVVKHCLCPDLSLAQIKNHFKTKVNEKAHKLDPDREASFQEASFQFGEKYMRYMNDAMPQVSVSRHETGLAV